MTPPSGCYTHRARRHTRSDARTRQAPHHLGDCGLKGLPGDRLADIPPIGPCQDGGHHLVVHSLGGAHYQRHRAPLGLCPYGSESGEPVHLRQIPIGEDHSERLLSEAPQRFRTMVGLQDMPLPHPLQQVSDHLTHAYTIFDNQRRSLLGNHSRYPPWRVRNPRRALAAQARRHAPGVRVAG